MKPENRGLVSLRDVRDAADRIRGIVVRTPLLPDPYLSRRARGEIRLKCESLQRAGSFKARGASNFIGQLSPEELAGGVVTYSSGNHAQAVAFAAGLHDARAVVVMPVTAPDVKIHGARRLGARVELAGTTSEHRRAVAEELAQAEGRVMVPPFDHPWIIAGQGTMALEALEDWPEADTFVVPIGGGGQAAGWGAAVRRLKPGAKIIGVEPRGAATMRRALDAGGPVTLEKIDTIADGLAPTRAGNLTYAHAAAFLDDVVLVEDADIRRAAAYLLEHRKLVVEYSGAAPTAALLSGVVPTSGRKVCAVLSGGNLDASLVGEVLSSRETPTS